MDDLECSVYLKDKGFEDPEEDIYFLLARNGLFKVTKTIFFEASTLFFIPLRGKKLEELRRHKIELKLCLPKKIPARIYKKSLDFFRQRFKASGIEAVSLLYWHEEEKDYKLIIPTRQEGKSFFVLGEVGPNPNGTIRAGTIHSHGNFTASHSGTDDEDEAHDDGLHITIGGVMEKNPSISCSVVVDGQRFIVAKEDIFENKPDVAKQADDHNPAVEEQPKKVEPKPLKKDIIKEVDTSGFLIPTWLGVWEDIDPLIFV